jgi:hypothetical protein
MISAMETLTQTELDALRTLVQDLANRPDWPALLALEPRLRRDTEYWHWMWAPALAMAAGKLGDPRARAFLDEAVAGGFSQPEVFEGELEALFGAEPYWPGIVEAMAANTPPPALELLDWPELSPALPVRLFEIAADRRDALRERLPEPRGSAWETARELLHWATTRWDHSGSSHVERADALHVLDRAAAGERFACTEYSTVLTQALNAVGIPARFVSLLTHHHHTGMGRSHDVTEAWIDDLGAWVVLDGQNGMYWTGADGAPLGLVELHRRERAGEPPPPVVSLAGKASAEALALWWPHFHVVAPTGLVLAPAPYSPVLETTRLLPGEQLRRKPSGTHPDLLELGIGVAGCGERPALVPVSRHPHARGFEVALDGASWRLGLAGDPDVAGEPYVAGEPWPLPDGPAGDYAATIATVTAFGPQRRQRLSWVRRR